MYNVILLLFTVLLGVYAIYDHGPIEFSINIHLEVWQIIVVLFIICIVIAVIHNRKIN